MKIGIYGGSFNPPHLGHQNAAVEAAEKCALDKLLLIPAGISPHKVMEQGSPANEHRLAMTRLMGGQAALQSGIEVEVLDLEMAREGKSYTVDTLRALRRQYPNGELLLFMGTDMFFSFESWRAPEEIAKLAKVVAFYRNADDSAAAFAAQAEKLRARFGGSFEALALDRVIEVSSTALRAGMASGTSEAMLEPQVYGYILRESIRLSNLINDLLELSRLQSGGVAFSKGRVELYEIAYDVADRMNDAAAQRGKSVRLEAPEGEYYAYTNADRIEQVLIALVDNAIKHGTDGCTVSVNLFENAEKNRYEFVVSNPAEVDPADLEHLFERFYKADHAHTGDGTGLGLAIVSEVLNLLGEKIDIEYENGIIAFRFTAEKCSTPKKHRALQKAENKNEDGEPTA